jgi:hypothetical protein
MDRAEYVAQGNHFNANPTKSFNFLSHFEDQLQFVERDPRLRVVLNEVLGKAKGNSGSTGIDASNAGISGKLRSVKTRSDLDAKGMALIRGNIINKDCP